MDNVWLGPNVQPLTHALSWIVHLYLRTALTSMRLLMIEGVKRPVALCYVPLIVVLIKNGVSAVFFVKEDATPQTP